MPLKVMAPFAERFWRRVDRSGECWLWLGGRDRHGYGLCYLGGGRKHSRNGFAHRIAYRMEHGEIPEGLDVCHHCDNPPCCRPSHLFAGDALANMRDAAAKGRTARGDQTGPRLHPESMPRGAKHWTARTDPAIVRAKLGRRT